MQSRTGYLKKKGGGGLTRGNKHVANTALANLGAAFMPFVTSQRADSRNKHKRFSFRDAAVINTPTFAQCEPLKVTLKMIKQHILFSNYSLERAAAAPPPATAQATASSCLWPH